MVALSSAPGGEFGKAVEARYSAFGIDTTDSKVHKQRPYRAGDIS
jgi:hypothetical protein